MVAWCFVSVVWNLAVAGCLIRSADKEQVFLFLVLVPFSLIGLFLLLLLFTSVSVAIDSLLQIGRKTPSVNAAPLPQPILAPQPSHETLLKKSPILNTLFLASSLNWLLFFGISIYFGGDALGTLPSRDGFVLTSHGHHTAVSEAVWQFSLVYSGARLLLTPLIGLSFGAWQFSNQLKAAHRIKKWMICAFILVWVLGWYSSIGRSIYRSVNDWRALKRPSTSLRN